MRNHWIMQRKQKLAEAYTQNVERLKGHRLLDHIQDEYHRGEVAKLIENQRLYNNDIGVGGFLGGIYRRIAVPIVARLYDPDNLLALKLVSMQAMQSPAFNIKFLRFRYQPPKKKVSLELGPYSGLGPNDLVLMDPGVESDPDDLPEISLVQEEEGCAAKTRKMKVMFPLMKANEKSETEGFTKYHDDLYLTPEFNDYIGGQLSPNNIDTEAEMSIYMRKHLTDDINSEILTDLWRNVGTIGNWEFPTGLSNHEMYESLYIKIIEMSSIIHRKTLRGGANWLVVSPELAKLLGQIAYHNFAERDTDAELFYHGTMNSRWRVYSSKTAIPRNEILLGYKSEAPKTAHLDSGYFYNPYIPMGPTPVAVDLETKMTPYGTLNRYSKKLLREGAKFYGKIILTGF